MKKAARIIIRSAASLLAISVAAFLIIMAMPADPIRIALQSWNLPITDEHVAMLRAEWGLDLPLLHQYGLWLSRFVTGDWGTSFRTHQPILQEFITRLPLSLTLGVSGLALATVLAIPIGFAASRHRGGFADVATRILSVSVQAVPIFWLGLLLIWLLGVQLKLIRPFATGPGAMVLPLVLVTLYSLGTLSRVYRRAMLEVENALFFRTALAKGLSHDRARWRHGHGHALYALLASLRAEAGWAIGGGAAVEVLFGLPGISQFLVQSIGVRDYFVLQAYVMVIAVWMIVMNAGIETMLGRIDVRRQ